MVNKFNKYLKDLELNKPASLNEIHEVESKLGYFFPKDYIDFLLISNGFEGSFGESYVKLWSIDEIIENNEGYEVKEFVPQILLIGSNGGGEAFGLDYRLNPIKYIMIPFIFEYEAIIVQGNTLMDFFDRLYLGLLFD